MFLQNDLDASRVLIGTGNWHPFAWDAPPGDRLVSEQTATDIVAQANRLGVRGFKTADGYGFGRAETALGSAIRVLGISDTYVASKVGYNFYNRTYKGAEIVSRPFRTLPDTTPVPFDQGQCFNAPYLAFAASRSRTRLGCVPDVALHCVSAGQLRKPELEAALAELICSGSVGQFGAAVDTPEAVIVATRMQLRWIQVPLHSLASVAMNKALKLAAQHLEVRVYSLNRTTNATRTILKAVEHDRTQINDVRNETLRCIALSVLNLNAGADEFGRHLARSFFAARRY